MTRAQYLSLALNLGMSVREAMLEKIRTVYEICDIRAAVAKEARARARQR